MNIQDLDLHNINSNQLDDFIELLKTSKKDLFASGVDGSALEFILSSSLQKIKKPFIIITATQKEAQSIFNNICFFLNQDTGDLSGDAVLFETYDGKPYDIQSPSNHIVANRLNTLYRLTVGRIPGIIVMPVAALIQRLIPKKILSESIDIIMKDEEIDRTALISHLVEIGYYSTSIVESPGDMAIRGGIIDLYSPMYEHPARIELFGDNVESIRLFDRITQRSLETLDEIEILPASEIILTKERAQIAAHQILINALEKDISSDAIHHTASDLRQQILCNGIEYMLPWIYKVTDSLFDYIPGNSLIILNKTTELAPEIERFIWDIKTKYNNALLSSRSFPEPEKIFMNWAEVKEKLLSYQTLSIQTILMDATHGKDVLDFGISIDKDINIHKTDSQGRLLAPFIKKIETLIENANNIHIICHTDKQEKRLASIMGEYNIETTLDKFHFPSGKPGIHIIKGHLTHGFTWPSENLVFITEDEIFGIKKRRSTITKPVSGAQAFIQSFNEINKEDFVVHLNHGVGRYKGLTRLVINNITNDFILVEYAEKDKLYIPVHRLNLLQKYMGMDNENPSLDNLGEKTFEQAKIKAKASIEELAGELIKIYATRKLKEGHQFSPIDNELREFESSFEYEETPGQLKAIDDVLFDMTSNKPMDRLVCGDVGYGKTEVAIRACFKAVMDGLQVAVLVPTTILAEQHYTTFLERFKTYPIEIKVLSRFKTQTEIKKIIKDISLGKADIVIGTHRLLQKDVQFNKLGLIIIDEEHRFGVKHKETLKKIKTTVDCLTLTATPIPRTLHMSLSGIKDISVIQTPPEDRLAITTQLSSFNDQIIRQAILNEFKRDGQIYFVHNHVKGIYPMANHLAKLVPEVRFAVAHGQMKEKELEEVMYAFMRHEIDCIVCTTIIESGLDIPSANTIIINRADKMGLAQMYQLRGRVGRSDKQAYAYLLIPGEEIITRNAQRRIKALMDFSELGSGFKIAMNDLQIRGGGNIIGAEQSGHIAAIGYELYLNMMEEAIASMKGEKVDKKVDPEISIPVSAIIPETYCPDNNERLFLYRRISSISDPDEIKTMKDELQDRFGPFPQEVNNLFRIIEIKKILKSMDIIKLEGTEKNLALTFSKDAEIDVSALISIVSENSSTYRLTPEMKLIIKYTMNGKDTISAAKNALLRLPFAEYK